MADRTDLHVVGEGLDKKEELDKTEFTEEEVAKGMNETVTGRRKVSIPGLGDVVLRYPNRDDELEADAERSKAFTRFLLDGLKTEEEMKQIAAERGLWTEAHDKQVENLQAEMVKLRVQIKDSKPGNEEKRLRKKLLDKRTEYLNLLVKKNGIFSHTVESKAMNVWWQYLAYRCTYDAENKKRIWKTYQDFLDELSSGPTTQLITEFISFYNGLSDNFFDLWQEEEIELQESGEKDGE
jgi:hypothetical protein